MCFALRRYSSIGLFLRFLDEILSAHKPPQPGTDTARQIYQNATLEKIYLLRTLHRDSKRFTEQLSASLSPDRWPFGNCSC